MWALPHYPERQRGTNLAQLLPVGTDEVILNITLTAVLFLPSPLTLCPALQCCRKSVWTNPAAVSTAGGLTAWHRYCHLSAMARRILYSLHDQRFGSGSPPKVYVQHINSSGQAVFTQMACQYRLRPIC